MNKLIVREGESCKEFPFIALDDVLVCLRDDLEKIGYVYFTDNVYFADDGILTEHGLVAINIALNTIVRCVLNVHPEYGRRAFYENIIHDGSCERYTFVKYGFKASQVFTFDLIVSFMHHFVKTMEDELIKLDDPDYFGIFTKNRSILFRKDIKIEKCDYNDKVKILTRCAYVPADFNVGKADLDIDIVENTSSK